MRDKKDSTADESPDNNRRSVRGAKDARQFVCVLLLFRYGSLQCGAAPSEKGLSVQ